MIFKDLLEEKRKELQSDFQRLYQDVLDKQTHTGDVYLVISNRIKTRELEINNKIYLEDWDNKMNRAYETNSDFIYTYLETSCNLGLKYTDYCENKDLMSDSYANVSIQSDMLIYLKIWENSLFIKRLYQIARLAKGDSYWYDFKIIDFYGKKKIIDNENGSYTIPHAIKLTSEELSNYPAIKNALSITGEKCQIRNAIAHSDYHIFGNGLIELCNYKDGDSVNSEEEIQLHAWINIYHTTLAMFIEHSELMGRFKQYVVDTYLEKQRPLFIRKWDGEEVEVEPAMLMYLRKKYPKK